MGMAHPILFFRTVASRERNTLPSVELATVANQQTGFAGAGSHRNPWHLRIPKCSHSTALIKLPAITLLLLVLCCSFAQAQDAGMVAIRSLTDPAKIATLKDPHACNDRLLKVVYWLNQAQQVGRDPQVILDASLVQQPRIGMLKESLLRNLLIANRLGLLTPANLDAMKRGKSPTVTLGPYAGEIAEVDHILPFAKFPQYGKEFWNLELMPQTLNRRKSDKVGQRQMDLLRKLNP
jgi:hypothetical protein